MQSGSSGLLQTGNAASIQTCMHSDNPHAQHLSLLKHPLSISHSKPAKPSAGNALEGSWQAYPVAST